jgi:hypothetical protein
MLSEAAIRQEFRAGDQMRMGMLIDGSLQWKE